MAMCLAWKEGETTKDLLKIVQFFEKKSISTVRRFYTDDETESRRASNQREQEGVEIDITTWDTAQSNGLPNETHSSILGPTRTCLEQEKILHNYWDFPVGHVLECKAFFEHLVTGLVLQIVAFRSMALDLGNSRPFGCGMYLQSLIGKFSEFQNCPWNWWCLQHEGGAIYGILTKNINFRAMRVRGDASVI